MMFGGRLTPAPGVPYVSQDTTSATLAYSPCGLGTVVPLRATLPGLSTSVSSSDTQMSFAVNCVATDAMHRVSFLSSPADQIGLTLDLSPLPVGTYDIYTTYHNGAAVLGAVELNPHTLFAGILVNSAPITLAITGGTAEVAAQHATWLGRINIGVAGQVTCHTSYGLARRWDVWNAYNQASIKVKCGRIGAPHGYVPAEQPSYSVSPCRGDINHSIAILAGGKVTTRMIQAYFLNGLSAYWCGIGWGVTTGALNFYGNCLSGPWGIVNNDANLPTGGKVISEYVTDLHGAVVAYALEGKRNNVTAFSGEEDSHFTAEWMG